MKKIIIIFFTLIYIFLLFGCYSLKTKEIITISGKLELSDNEGFEYVIFDKDESRSRTGYYIKKKNSNLKNYEKLPDFIDSLISVNAVLSEDKSPWMKIITLDEIIYNN